MDESHSRAGTQRQPQRSPLKRTAFDDGSIQGPPLKVPRRTSPTPVVRIREGLTVGPHSPVLRLTPRERWVRAAQQARFKYKYSVILEDHIRLLIVNRGEALEEVFVSLHSVPINELRIKHEYEALSYHWGDGDLENPVYVRDFLEDGQIKSIDEAVRLGLKRLWVKSNLYKALRHLRRNDSEVILWVDAICIDQENEEEKKLQIARMAQIYSLAERVCIWLGAGDERSDNAIKFIKNIINLKGLEKLTHDENYTSRWKELADLMRRSWFSRRWVIQELALARDATVHCGAAEIHWYDFRDGISLFAMHFDTIRKLFIRSGQSYDNVKEKELGSLGAKVLVDVIGNIFRKNADGAIFEPVMGLETLVSTLSTFETADPRDTVHAFRNIAKEIPWFSSSRGEQALPCPPPKPDYGKDLLEVYTDFVRWVIHTSGSMDIICRHWAIPEKETPTFNYPKLVILPSWIQEISDSPFGRQQEGYSHRKNGDSFVGLPGRKFYSASHGKDASEVRFGVDLPQRSPSTSRRRATRARKSSGRAVPRLPRRKDPSLFVKGLQIGTITWASDAIPDGVIPQVCLQKGDWSGQGQDRVKKAPDKLWRTLVADRGPDGGNPPSWYHRACLHCLVNDTPNGHINTSKLLEKSQPDIVRDYLKRVQAVTWNRVFLEADTKTSEKEALFGLGPPKTKEKDVVCILFGCSVPCVLRKHPYEQGGYYEFIGEAFIYGKMDGEAVSVLSEEELQQQTKEFRLL